MGDELWFSLKTKKAIQHKLYIIVLCLYRPTVRNLRLVFFIFCQVCVYGFEEVMDGRGRLGVLKRNFRMKEVRRALIRIWRMRLD